MNTEYLINRLEDAIEALLTSDVEDVQSWNDSFFGIADLRATMNEYQALNVEPPPSFVAYVEAQIDAAMPDGAWAESEGAR